MTIRDVESYRAAVLAAVGVPLREQARWHTLPMHTRMLWVRAWLRVPYVEVRMRCSGNPYARVRVDNFRD